MKTVRPSVEQTRPGVKTHSDVDRLENEVRTMSQRWRNCRKQVSERLKSCQSANQLLEKYNLPSEEGWMDQLDSKLKTLEQLETARAREALEKHTVRYKMEQNRQQICMNQDCY